MSNENNILQEAEAILEKAKKLKTAPLKVEELISYQESYFSPAARKAMEREVKQLAFNDEGTVYSTVFLAARGRTDNLVSAVEKVASQVNELAEKGHIHSRMTNLLKLDLALMPFEVPQSVVICYVNIPATIADQMRTEGKTLIEGSLPACVESTAVELAHGEFLMEVRLGYDLLKDKVVTPRKRLRNEIKKILAMMPEGTELVSFRECAITGLSLPFEVKFKHPAFDDIVRAEVSYSRYAGREASGGIKEFSLLREISYYRKDGTRVG